MSVSPEKHMGSFLLLIKVKELKIFLAVAACAAWLAGESCLPPVLAVQSWLMLYQRSELSWLAECWGGWLMLTCSNTSLQLLQRNCWQQSCQRLWTGSQKVLTDSAIGKVNVHCNLLGKRHPVVCALHFIFWDNHLSTLGNTRGKLTF